MTPSLWTLLIANAFPIVGVLFLGWTVFPLVLLYWLENVVVGSYNVLKLLLAQPRQPWSWAGKLFLVPFFLVHFGGFTYVHGVLILALLGPKSAQPFDLLATLPAAIRANQLGWAVVGLVVSHGLSFYSNYLKSGEYQRAQLNTLMMQPYARVMVLHMTVLIGGWLVLTLGSPLYALVLLVALKTSIDVRAHVAERRKFGAPDTPSPLQPTGTGAGAEAA